MTNSKAKTSLEIVREYNECFERKLWLPADKVREAIDNLRNQGLSLGEELEVLKKELGL